jgi:hypothetical protein
MGTPEASPPGTISPAANAADAGVPLRLVVFSPRAQTVDEDQPDPLIAALCEQLNCNRIDALWAARQTPGMLPIDVPPNSAAALLQQLLAAGEQAQIVPADQLPAIDVPVIAHHVRITASELEVLDYRGEVAQRVPWSSIRVLAIGQVPEETTRRWVLHGDVGVSMNSEAVQSVAGHPLHGPELWLLCDAPRHVFRLNHRQLNYESLQDRKVASATTNFRVFAELLVQHAPQAWRTASTRAYLGQQPLDQFAFASSQALAQQALIAWMAATARTTP